jgi:hypothetical protein
MILHRILLVSLSLQGGLVAGVLVVADILERFEILSSNREQFLSLLKELSRFTQLIVKIKELPVGGAIPVSVEGII